MCGSVVVCAGRLLLKDSLHLKFHVSERQGEKELSLVVFACDGRANTHTHERVPSIKRILSRLGSGGVRKRNMIDLILLLVGGGADRDTLLSAVSHFRAASSLPLTGWPTRRGTMTTAAESGFRVIAAADSRSRVMSLMAVLTASRSRSFFAFSSFSSSVRAYAPSVCHLSASPCDTSTSRHSCSMSRPNRMYQC